MEDKLIKKPCVVQKIETPQGFSVSYKERFLYSKYNPSKNIISAVENLQIPTGTVILCFSPILGYGLKELINKLQENCLIVLCEAEQNLYDFFITEIKVPDSVLIIKPAELSDLPLKLYNLAKSGKYKRVMRLDMSGGVQFNSDLYNRLFSACTENVMTFWKNRITLTRFGRKYSRNLFENLHYLAKSKPITDFFNSVEKPLIVFGAGESTQLFIDRMIRCCTHRNVLELKSLRNQKPKQSILSNYFILCADTALQPLLINGIIPDGVFIEEAQSVIAKAFTGTPKNIHIFAGLSSIPNIAHRAGAENISYFFTEYSNGSFFNSLIACNFMPPANIPFGSVGLTAVYYALKFRKNDTVPVYFAGLDFSYSAGITHTRGALAHLIRLTGSNRLIPVENYNAAYGPGTEKLNGKNGGTVITTPTLKNYAAMFQNFFGDEKNLFDAGECGIDLGLPHADIDCFAENTATFHCEAERTSNPSVQELEAFLSTERTSLENLRDLLVGKTELTGEALLQEIKKIAEPREYLYLHFADGWQFSTAQSFLNRIRTEIDFFLKYL